MLEKTTPKKRMRKNSSPLEDDVWFAAWTTYPLPSCTPSPNDNADVNKTLLLVDSFALVYT